MEKNLSFLKEEMKKIDSFHLQEKYKKNVL